MIQFLCDDLNTQGMLGLVFEHAAELAADEQLAAVVYELLRDVLGLALVSIVEKAVEITPEIQLLLDERLAARDRRD